MNYENFALVLKTHVGGSLVTQTHSSHTLIGKGLVNTCTQSCSAYPQNLGNVNTLVIDGEQLTTQGVMIAANMPRSLSHFKIMQASIPSKLLPLLISTAGCSQHRKGTERTRQLWCITFEITLLVLT